MEQILWEMRFLTELRDRNVICDHHYADGIREIKKNEKKITNNVSRWSSAYWLR